MSFLNQIEKEIWERKRERERTNVGKERTNVERERRDKEREVIIRERKKELM